MKSLTSIATTHVITRLEIEVSQPYDSFCEKFEKAVPPLDQQRMADFIKRKAPWQDVLDDAVATAPLGFFIFWHLEVSASMALAGNTTLCNEYLMGNYTIAERMFRVDPMVMLYVPLRVLIYAKQGGPTTFIIEKPSSVLASLSNAKIEVVGKELDSKLIALFRHLEVSAPRELDESGDER